MGGRAVEHAGGLELQAWLALSASALLMVAAPVLGDEVGAGASGQCWDPAGNGGADEARATVDSHDPTASAVVVPSGTGAAAALAEATDSGCTNARTYDYVEADVTAGETFVQVCYDGAPRTDGACPTSPSGLPA